MNTSPTPHRIPSRIAAPLLPLALKGVKYREVSAGELLKRNMLVYGLGGVAAPFVAIKAIDMILTVLHLS